MSSVKRSLRHAIALLITLVIAVHSAIAGQTASPPEGKLRWKAEKIQIAISSSLLTNPANISGEGDITAAVERGVRSWAPYIGIEITTVRSDRQSASIAGPAGDGVSLITIAATPENVLLFSGGEKDAAAKTRVFYNRQGAITEADIVLNPYQQFSVGGTYGTFDLENTIAHEVGHLLGLKHSPVVGSMMFDMTARNGIFGIPGVAPRVIAADDIAGLRDLYPGDENGSCCGVAVGKIIGYSKTHAGMDVWAEDAATGRVIGQTGVQRDGTYRLGGLETGEVSLYGEAWSKTGEYPVTQLGRVELNGSVVSPQSVRGSKRVRAFSLYALGINGMLGDASLQLEPGRTYTILAGGQGLDAGAMKLFSSSPFFKINDSSVRSIDFREGISTVSFELTVAEDALGGNYTIFASDQNGDLDAVVGGITVVRSRSQASLSKSD